MVATILVRRRAFGGCIGGVIERLVERLSRCLYYKKTLPLRRSHLPIAPVLNLCPRPSRSSFGLIADLSVFVIIFYFVAALVEIQLDLLVALFDFYFVKFALGRDFYLALSNCPAGVFALDSIEHEQGKLIILGYFVFSFQPLTAVGKFNFVFYSVFEEFRFISVGLFFPDGRNSRMCGCKSALDIIGNLSGIGGIGGLFGFTTAADKQ